DPRLAEGQQQVGDVTVAGNVAAVRQRVLRDEDRLLDAARRQSFDLFHDVGQRPTPVTAAELWNRAEGAAHIAPFRDLHVRIGHAAGQQPWCGRVVEIPGRRRARPVLTAGRLADQIDDAREVRGAEDAVDFRHLLEDVATVALSEAAGDDERAAGALLLQLRELQDRVDRFFARAVDEGAGVDDEALGIFGALGQRESSLGQHAEHQLGIDLVLRAAEGRQVDLHGREPVYSARRANLPGQRGRTHDGAATAAHARLSIATAKSKYCRGSPPTCGSGTHQSHHSSFDMWTVTGTSRNWQEPTLTSAL